eukprot:scaffold28544_cov78-Attheya_sp.AAC.5
MAMPGTGIQDHQEAPHCESNEGGGITPYVNSVANGMLVREATALNKQLAHNISNCCSVEALPFFIPHIYACNDHMFMPIISAPIGSTGTMDLLVLDSSKIIN